MVVLVVFAVLFVVAASRYGIAVAALAVLLGTCFGGAFLAAMFRDTSILALPLTFVGVVVTIVAYGLAAHRGDVKSRRGEIRRRNIHLTGA